MIVKDLEISFSYEMNYIVNIIFNEESPIELKRIAQEVCKEFLQIYCSNVSVRVEYGIKYHVPLYEIDIINEKILEEIAHSPNARYIDGGKLISFWCESIKQNIYIRDSRKWKYEFEKSLFNLNVTYSEKHIGKYSNFSNKI